MSAGHDRPRILVVGGSGYFGRLLVEDLNRHADAEVVTAGRSSTPPLDLLRPETIAPALDGVRIAVCAAGPYQGMPLTLLQLCLERGVHYIDLSDDRGFLRAAHAMVRAKPDQDSLPAVCAGWSAVPALSGLLAGIAVAGMDRVDSLEIQIAPGNRLPRNVGTVASLLSSVGRPFTILQEGTWREARGWSEPRAFRFPLPVGARTGYLVDVPDHELFPELFGARGVAFRVGSELPVLNLALSFLAGLPCRDWPPWAPAFRKASALLGFLGHDWGAVGVEASGSPAGRRVSVVADREGQRIPVMPAAVMAAMLASGEASWRGLPPLDRWIGRDRLEAECARRGHRLIVEELPRA